MKVYNWDEKSQEFKLRLVKNIKSKVNFNFDIIKVSLETAIFEKKRNSLYNKLYLLTIKWIKCFTNAKLIYLGNLIFKIKLFMIIKRIF